MSDDGLKKGDSMTSPRRRAFQVFLVTAAVGLLLAAWLVHGILTYADRATGSARGPVEVEIPRGSGAQKVSELLSESGLIERPGFFRLYAGQRGAAIFQPLILWPPKNLSIHRNRSLKNGRFRSWGSFTPSRSA